MLSYHLWRQVFNADPSAVGRSVIMRGEPYTIVGVMPERFQSDAAADLWTPLRPSTTGEGDSRRHARLVVLRHATAADRVAIHHAMTRLPLKS